MANVMPITPHITGIALNAGRSPEPAILVGLELQTSRMIILLSRTGGVRMTSHVGWSWHPDAAAAEEHARDVALAELDATL